MTTGQTATARTDHHIDDLDMITADQDIAIAVIATPAHAARSMAASLVAAGVTSTVIAPCALTVPDGVHVRKIDLAVELQILSFLEWRKASSNGASPRGSREQTVPL